MSSQITFDDGSPKFPTDIPTAQISRISLSALIANDPAESQRLFNACVSPGFFHLDLRSPEGALMCDLLRRLRALNITLHEMPLDEKRKFAYDPPDQLFGFKESGRNKVESGAPDRYEAWAFSQDDILGIAYEPNRPLHPPPAAETEGKTLLQNYIRCAYDLLKVVFRHLDTHLDLREDTFTSMQSLHKPSQTTLRLLRYLPHPEGDRRGSLLGHTDIGSITLLDTSLGGLQILPPGEHSENEEAWRYVKPEDAHVFIGISDAMVEWTGGILRSCLHRVTFAPGAQATHTRYSAAYLVRPERSCLMKSLSDESLMIPDTTQGKVYTASEWEKRKAVGIIAGRDIARSRGGILPKRKEQ